MFFRKKKPKRLYYPVKSRWYTKPRRRPSVKRQNKLFKGGWKGIKKNLAKSIYLTITVGIFLILVIFLVFSSYFSVTDIDVVRENFNVDSAAIENELNQYIGKNIIFFPRSRIYKTIQTKFPEFSSVKINKKLPSTISIYLESHPAVANLRAYYILPKAEETTTEDFTNLNKAIEEISGSDSSLTISTTPSPLTDKTIADSVFTLEENKKEPQPVEQKSLLNRIGQAIFDQDENLELITITIKNLTQPVKDREQIVEKKHMDYILDSIKYLKNTMELEVVSLEYIKIAREIHLKTKNNLVLWVSIERDYKSQIDKLNTIYTASELDKEKLAYIDLRIRDKVIYCPTDAKCDE